MREEIAKLTAVLEEIEKVLATPGGLSPPQQDVILAELQERKERLQDLIVPLAKGAEGWTADRQSIVASRERGVGIVGAKNLAVSGAVGGPVILAESGATVLNIDMVSVPMAAVDRESALGTYLRHAINCNRFLQLQGIRSGGRLVHIELNRIYITLRATRQRIALSTTEQLVQGEEAWLAEETALASNELLRGRERPMTTTETVTISVNEALAAYPRLVVLGDPGSGKTTLLHYLALVYASDLAEGTDLVQQKLDLEENGRLPIILPLRKVSAYLNTYRSAEDGTEGHRLLLEYLLRSLKEERIELPADFFDDWLIGGQAVILLDGLDEVADPDLRRRVSRLVEAFTRTYPQCRYVVTSRIVGYRGAARLGEGYATTTIRDFTLADVELFLTSWHRLVIAGQMGKDESAKARAERQTHKLLQIIKSSERIRELAINPLMLTVIAIVHHDRVKLPDQRAELYAEAVETLLGRWAEAQGVSEMPVLEGKRFDTGDKRLILQSVALQMHERGQEEVSAEDLRQWLGELFQEIVDNRRAVLRAVDRFLCVIEERTGLLVARGQGVYAFSHLTFQEYLTALAVAARDDYVEYTLERIFDPWWREVILLEAGHLSTQSKERTTRLIQAVSEREEELEPYHNLVLASECLRDVGINRVQRNLATTVQKRLRADLDVDLWAEIERRRPRSKWEQFRRRLQGERVFGEERIVKEVLERRKAVTQALVRTGAGYWTPPYGEPEWIRVPDGEFWMGMQGEEHPLLTQNLGGNWGVPRHLMRLPAYVISRVPVTNAQYQLFVEATSHEPPDHWEEGRPPKGFESHPVVNITWYNALAYCRWLSKVTSKHITLPSEAEWEKAARGDNDQRVYPWGDTFDAACCNSVELGLGESTPVGIFLNGASPYGVLDMAGNVWEWTRSLWGEKWYEPEFKYPYNPEDGRENLEAGTHFHRVLRGGSFCNNERGICCPYRRRSDPIYRDDDVGFRVVALFP